MKNVKKVYRKEGLCELIIDFYNKKASASFRDESYYLRVTTLIHAEKSAHALSPVTVRLRLFLLALLSVGYSRVSSKIHSYCFAPINSSL